MNRQQKFLELFVWMILGIACAFLLALSKVNAAPHHRRPVTVHPAHASCGKERWDVKVGKDADAATVDVDSPVQTTIAELIARQAPTKADLPASARVMPTETTVYALDVTLIGFKEESDSDYHLVLQDDNGRTMIAEIPDPACVGASSPFAAAIIKARQTFEAGYKPTPRLRKVSMQVHITGVGFFDFAHGQTGVAPNAIELHPVLSIEFIQ